MAARGCPRALYGPFSGPGTVLGYSQGGTRGSRVPGASNLGGQLWAAGAESLSCCFGTSCRCGQLLDELLPLRRVVPSGGTLGKEKERCSAEQRRTASYVLFLSRGHGAAQGLGEVLDLCV